MLLAQIVSQNHLPQTFTIWGFLLPRHTLPVPQHPIDFGDAAKSDFKIVRNEHLVPFWITKNLFACSLTIGWDPPPGHII